MGDQRSNKNRALNGSVFAIHEKTKVNENQPAQTSSRLLPSGARFSICHTSSHTRQWELLQELNQREAELGEKRKKRWITDEEYTTEKAKIAEERLELQTRPE